jgi:aspartate--ammonia ligase
MPDLYIAENYEPFLSLRETERAIKFIKDFFQDNLAKTLNLQRISAPVFLRKGSGVNDDLNGVETKAAFQIKDDNYSTAEMLFSLAKWKRMVLAEYGFECGEGLYTDMMAIRPDEECLDNLHSIYVDQWDWERVMQPEERSLDFLKDIVRKIYGVMLDTEQAVFRKYPNIEPILPEEIQFIHTEELLERFPDLNPRQREDAICKEVGAAFIIGIGGELPDGTKHDGRAPDYDDWVTPTDNGKIGLNGDIFGWNPILNRGFEFSSMGIRVSPDSMLEQLKIRDEMQRTEQEWHKRLLNGEFPQTIGGGIGQSRLCMFFLHKCHIGEVQATIWPEEMVQSCRAAGIALL